MKNCTHCKYAEWNRTKTGRLSPDGSGWCRYPWRMPPLPQSMYFYSDPKPAGGHIGRREDLKDDCVYFAWRNEEPKPRQPFTKQETAE